MDDSTTAAASSAVDAWWSGSGVAGTRLCGAQIQPVPARESRLALTHSHQTFLWIATGAAVAQGFLATTATAASLLHPTRSAIAKTKPYPKVNLAFAHEQHSREDWGKRQCSTDNTANLCPVSTQLSSGRILLKSQIQLLQSLSVTPAAQVWFMSIVRGDCLDDVVFGLAKNSGCSVRQAKGHELSQTGLELASFATHSPLEDASVSISIWST